ncbi:MAG: methionyl-tRNA formyltransferase [Acidimicrobiia bacterium]
MITAAFFGTPPAAVPTLAALTEVADVKLVITRPDRPKGRSSLQVSPAVKEAAADWALPVVQPERANDIVGELRVLGVDVGVLVAYGQLLPPDLLAAPARGFVNVHFSLLPRWRGASPVVRAILAGDEETGVTLIQMDEGLDTGPMILAEATPIRGTETAGELTARLAFMGATLVRHRLGDFVAGRLELQVQEVEGATVAGKVLVEEAHLSPAQQSAEVVARVVRAFNPRPGAWATENGERLKVWRAAVAPDDEPPPAGEAELRDDRLLLGTRAGTVELLEVQPAGRDRMTGTAWARGRRGEPATLE